MSKFVCYYKNSFTSAETKYNTHDYEILSLVDTLKKFILYLSSGHIIVVTDHKSLKYIKYEILIL